MNQYHKTSDSSFNQRSKWVDRAVALYGVLGATTILLMASYIFTTYLESVTFDPSLERLHFQVFFATILTIASSTALVYGSSLIWKGNSLKGGIINLFAGTLVPLPTYVYFTFFCEPSFLLWLGPLGWFLFVPAIISGATGIIKAKFSH